MENKFTMNALLKLKKLSIKIERCEEAEKAIPDYLEYVAKEKLRNDELCREINEFLKTSFSEPDNPQRKYRKACKFCAFIGTCALDLKRHVIGHYPNEMSNFQCQFCTRVYRSRVNLKDHLIVHSGSYEQFKCRYCNYFSNSSKILIQHVAKKHGRTMSGRPIHPGQCCPHCDLIVARASYLKRHIDRVHSPKETEIITNAKAKLAAAIERQFVIGSNMSSPPLVQVTNPLPQQQFRPFNFQHFYGPNISYQLPLLLAKPTTSYTDSSYNQNYPRIYRGEAEEEVLDANGDADDIVYKVVPWISAEVIITVGKESLKISDVEDKSYRDAPEERSRSEENVDIITLDDDDKDVIILDGSDDDIRPEVEVEEDYDEEAEGSFDFAGYDEDDGQEDDEEIQEVINCEGKADDDQNDEQKKMERLEREINLLIAKKFKRKRLTCRYCPYKAMCAIGYKRHLVDHYPNNTKLCCQICQEVFQSKLKFRHHLLIHSGPDEQHKCPFCDFFTHIWYKMSQHVSQEHGTDMRGEDIAAELKCTECGYVGATTSVLQRHIQSMHIYGGEGLFQCPHCDFKIRNGFLLKEHIKQNHGSNCILTEFACDWCGETFSSEDLVRKHQSELRMSCTRFKCTRCCCRFATSQVLVRHQMHTRHGSESYCLSCEIHMHSHIELSNHYKIVHQPWQPK